MSSIDSVLLMHVLDLCLLVVIPTSAHPFHYESKKTGVTDRNVSEALSRQHTARETEEVSVPSSGEWIRGVIPTEYRISLLKKDVVVKVTGDCKGMGSNAVIQTVDDGAVTSAVFADAMRKYCYQGRTRTPQPVRVILTSMHQVVSGVAVAGQDVVFFRPLPAIPSTNSTIKSTRSRRSSANDPAHSERNSWCNQDNRNELKDVHLVPHVKILVVVDKLTADRHDGSIETYVQTVMSIVQELFSKQTVGLDINLSVVRLIILRENLKELPITFRARSTLRAFCEWQKTVSSPTRHDLAILLTGHDLCLGGSYSCNIAGHANVNSMCTSSKSCMVIEDQGLRTAFAIAQEIGKVFGLTQDGRSNNCSASKGYIMSPTSGTANIFRWSKCSKYELATSLRNSSCLLEADFLSPVIHVLPGETYNASQQCQLMRLHGDARICPHGYARDEICSSLWCQIGDNTTCVSTSTPTADGTPCGHGNICMKGSCVDANCGGPSPSGSGICPRPVEGQSVELSRMSDENNSYMRWEITRREKIRLRGTKLCVVFVTQRYNDSVQLKLDSCIGEANGKALRYKQSKGFIMQKAKNRCLTVTNSAVLLARCDRSRERQQKWAFRSSVGHIVSLSARQLRVLSVCG